MKKSLTVPLRSTTHTSGNLSSLNSILFFKGGGSKSFSSALQVNIDTRMK